MNMRKRQGLRHESRTCKNGGILFRGKSCGEYGISGSSGTFARVDIWSDHS